MKTKRPKLLVILDTCLHNQLIAEKASTGASMSYIIRKAVKQYFSKQKRKGENHDSDK